jgi:hypothetical protein
VKRIAPTFYFVKHGKEAGAFLRPLKRAVSSALFL